MSKKLKFILLILIGVIYLSLHLLKVQFTPFFLYGMYSKPVGEIESAEAYELKIDGEVFLPFDFGRERLELIVGPLDYYRRHLDLQGQDPVESFVLSKRPQWKSSALFNQIAVEVFTEREELDQFPNWYKSMLEGVLTKKITKLEVYKVSYDFNSQGIALKSRVLFMTVRSS